MRFLRPLHMKPSLYPGIVHALESARRLILIHVFLVLFACLARVQGPVSVSIASVTPCGWQSCWRRYVLRVCLCPCVRYSR